ncbi:MAG: FAD-dependent oxidoreductase [Alphaproteobacteria bacterium]|nr:FAD-dependent oxidoreductase [Alphaproteobacteria bacterium]
MSRVAVIGGGLVGVCCAVFARRAGHDVDLFERGDIGGGASFGNAGIMSSGGCVPMALPGVFKKLPKMLLAANEPLSIRWSYAPKLLPWLSHFVRSAKPARVEATSKALYRLQSAAHAAYDEIVETSAFDSQIASKGLLFPFSSKTAFEGSARARQIRTARGVQFEVVDRERLYELAPDLAAGFYNGVLFGEARHALNPSRLAQKLTQDFSGSGGRVKRVAVQMVRERQTVVDVVSAEERRGYGSVVIAAGAWSRQLLGKEGAGVPLESERGYHVMLPNPGVIIPRPMIFSEFGLAVTPMQGGVRISGLVEFAGLDAPPDFRKADRMLHRAVDLIPNLKIAGADYWMGHRPSLPDSMPVIGPPRSGSRLLFAFGHGHQGVGQAAITGKIIAALLSDAPLPLDIRPFSPVRFSRTT